MVRNGRPIRQFITSLLTKEFRSMHHLSNIWYQVIWVHRELQFSPWQIWITSQLLSMAEEPFDRGNIYSHVYIYIYCQDMFMVAHVLKSMYMYVIWLLNIIIVLYIYMLQHENYVLMFMVIHRVVCIYIYIRSIGHYMGRYSIFPIVDYDNPCQSPIYWRILAGCPAATVQVRKPIAVRSTVLFCLGKWYET